MVWVLLVLLLFFLAMKMRRRRRRTIATDALAGALDETFMMRQRGRALPNRRPFRGEWWV